MTIFYQEGSIQCFSFFTGVIFFEELTFQRSYEVGISDIMKSTQVTWSNEIMHLPTKAICFRK